MVFDSISRRASGLDDWVLANIVTSATARNSRRMSSAELGRGRKILNNGWLERVNAMTDTQIAASIFRCDKVKGCLRTLKYDLRNLTEDGAVVMKRPLHAVTFVDNHDMGDNEIVNDKKLAYSFILVHEGYPCIFWYDYFN